MNKQTAILLVFFFLSVKLWAQVPITSIDTTFRQAPRLPITAVLGAFPQEVVILRSQINNRKDTIIQNIRFSTGNIQGRQIVLAQTGIGKANAAATTALMLDHFSPEQVIFTGIAGGIHPLLQPGDLVVATRVAHHDYGTITPDSMLHRKTRNPFTMQENPEYFACDSNLVQMAVTAAGSVPFNNVWNGTDSTAPQVLKGTIVTGDVFVASDKATTYLRKRLDAYATEMEGAAVGQICWQQRVPFVVIRSISDNANNTASGDVKKFYEVAAYNSALLVKAMVAMTGKK